MYAITCERHCSTATPEVQRTKQRFFTVHAAVTPTRVFPAPEKYEYSYCDVTMGYDDMTSLGEI